MSIDVRTIAAAWVSGIDTTQQEDSVGQLELFVKALRKRETRHYFLAPFVSTQEKQDALASAGMNKNVADLVSWLDHKRLWTQIALVARFARKQVTTLTGASDVTVFSAVPLTDSERATLLKKMEAKREGTVRLHEKVTPSILGGLIIDEVGERLDLSIQGKLAAIRSAVKATIQHA